MKEDISEEKYLKISWKRDATQYFFVKKISAHTYEDIWDTKYPTDVGKKVVILFNKQKGTWQTPSSNHDFTLSPVFWEISIPTPTEIVLKILSDSKGSRD